jgi:hypothetical protein
VWVDEPLLRETFSEEDADFVVLDANPLDDINNTRRIAAVYLRGSEVDRAALRAKWAAARAAGTRWPAGSNR